MVSNMLRAANREQTMAAFKAAWEAGMRDCFLSIASPEPISWAGFLLLVTALLGEVAVPTIPEKYLSHKLLVVLFGGLAVIGYAIERIGDDEILSRLTVRAETAELELKTIKTPRTINDDQYAKFVACLKAAPKGPVYVRPGMVDTDGPVLAKRIEGALKDAGFAPPAQPFPGGNALSWSTAGVFLIVKDMTNSPHGAQIQRCFKSALNWSVVGYPDPNHPEGAVSIGIGPRF